MPSIISISLPKAEKNRLERLALSYGFSLPELSKRILAELSTEIPQESFEDYKNSKELKKSFANAMRDWKSGRISAKL